MAQASLEELKQIVSEQGYTAGIEQLKAIGAPYYDGEIAVNFQDVHKGLWQTQLIKKRVLRFTETIILAAIAIMYLVSFVQDRSYTMGLVLAVISLAVIAAVWVIPHMEARATASAYANSTKRFSICISQHGVFSRNEGLCVFFDLSEPMIVYETKQYFNLLIENRRLYVMPKSTMQPDQIAFLRNLFSNHIDGFKTVNL